ncbi:type 4a pilus biogenesis protein PilO [bacterium]|nr:type 4a pilus biogenesis protein PilO [bacterium]
MSIEQQPNKSNSSVVTIIALLLLIVATVGLFIFVFPKKDSLNKLAVDIAQKQVELNKSKSQLAKLQSVKDSFKGGEVTQKDVLNLVPDNVEEGKIIRTLANHSKENEITINSLSFGINNNKDGDYSILSVTTNLSGTHRNLIKFLQSLEKDGRKFSINTMSVQVLENGLENMSLNISAFYL